MDALGLVTTAVELGFAIKQSIDKVAQNSKRSRQLTDDIIETLNDLKNLHDNDERGFAGAVHLCEASARLQRNLESVHSLCQGLVPGQKQGKLKAKWVTWKNRDDIEGELLRLKEHAGDCLAKFTAFSTARTESVVARTEHALILHLAETRFQRSRVDVLVGKMLINSPWGEQALKKIEINISTRESIEREYLKLQAYSLAESLNRFVATRSPLQNEQPNADHSGPLIPVLHKSSPSIAVVHEIWLLRCSIEDADHAPLLQDTAQRLNTLGCSLFSFGLPSEAMAAYQGASQMYQSLSPQHPNFLPRMVNSDLNLVQNCIDQASLAVPMITRANAALDSYEAQTGTDACVLRARTLRLEGLIFLDGKDFESASQSFSASFNLYEEIIYNIPSIFPDPSPMAADQLASIFTNSSKACCGYAECMVKTGHAWEAVSILMHGVAHYEHLPPWAIEDYDVEKFGQQDMSYCLTRAIIQLYVGGQLSMAFLHDMVNKLLPLAVIRPRILSYALWDISAIYASLSAAHSTVPYHDVISVPVSSTFTSDDAYETLPIRLPSRLVELLSSVDMNILLHNFFTRPSSSAVLVGQIITVEYIKKRAEMLEEHEIRSFLSRLHFILGSHTTEEHRLPIYEVVKMLFLRISREERRCWGGEYYAVILFRLGMYASTLDVIGEYVSTPGPRTLSVQIVSLVKVGRTSEAIPLVQPFLLEFWSYILRWRVPGSSWADICKNTQLVSEIMMAMKMAWMLSAGYYEDVIGVELHGGYTCSLKRVVDEILEFVMARGGSQGRYTHLIPCELWDMFRSKCLDTDPITLLVGSQTPSLDPPTPLLISNNSSSAHPEVRGVDIDRTPPQPTTPTPTSTSLMPDPEVAYASQGKDAPSGSGGANDSSSAVPETETCEADIERTPPSHPTTSTSASPKAHPEITHPLTTIGTWYKPTLMIHLRLDIAIVVIAIVFYLAAGRGITLSLTFQ